MSRGYNRAVLMGNLARDPDVRSTTSGQKVARMTVACGRQWKDKSGAAQSHTDFVPVTVWGKLADICERYLRKGSAVLVEGRISVRDYDDPKSGEKRWSTEVVADNLVMLGGKKADESGDGAHPQGGNRSAGRGSSDDFGDFPTDIDSGGDSDVDIPF